MKSTLLVPKFCASRMSESSQFLPGRLSVGCSTRASSTFTTPKVIKAKKPIKSIARLRNTVLETSSSITTQITKKAGVKPSKQPVQPPSTMKK